MYKIKIDTTERKKKFVQLIEEDKRDKKDEIISERKGDIDIVSSIRDILLENNLKLSDIDEFIPNTGPGSFTGIKVGITISNVLNWTLGKKKISELDKPNYGKKPNISLPKELKT